MHGDSNVIPYLKILIVYFVATIFISFLVKISYEINSKNFEIWNYFSITLLIKCGLILECYSSISESFNSVMFTNEYYLKTPI